jgi:hypothetical protein
LRRRYEAVLNALSDGIDVAGVARKDAAIVDSVVN